MGNIINIIQAGVNKLPDMYFDGERREWILRFSFKDVLDYVATKTVVDNQRDAEQTVEKLFTDKDRDLMLVYLRGAVANVSTILARRMPAPADIQPDGVSFRLEVGENHDDSMAGVLHLRIMDYLCQYAYVKWIGADPQVTSKLEDGIRSAMHYRKHGILRRVQNLNI